MVTLLAGKQRSTPPHSISLPPSKTGTLLVKSVLAGKQFKGVTMCFSLRARLRMTPGVVMFLAVKQFARRDPTFLLAGKEFEPIPPFWRNSLIR